MPLHRLGSLLALVALVTLAACTDDDWRDEHRTLGDVSITVVGEGSVAAHTWNASSSCSVEADAGTTTTCMFPIEDDGAEIELLPIDPGAVVHFEVTACGKAAADDSFEVRGAGIAFRPRDLLLGAACPAYPIRVVAKFDVTPPDDDAGGDATNDAGDDAGNEAGDDATDEVGGDAGDDAEAGADGG